jgi:hypothetical protein
MEAKQVNDALDNGVRLLVVVKVVIGGGEED